jgi:hypothetical protein
MSNHVLPLQSLDWAHIYISPPPFLSISQASQSRRNTPSTIKLLCYFERLSIWKFFFRFFFFFWCVSQDQRLINWKGRIKFAFRSSLAEEQWQRAESLTTDGSWQWKSSLSSFKIKHRDSIFGHLLEHWDACCSCKALFSVCNNIFCRNCCRCILAPTNHPKPRKSKMKLVVSGLSQ